MPDSTLQKAQLIPINPSGTQLLLDQAITVHFNPESLKLSYTITNKADTGSKNSSDQAAQQASSSSAKLAATGEPTFDLLAGPAAGLFVGPVAILAQAGPSARKAGGVSAYGVFAMGGVGAAF